VVAYLSMVKILCIFRNIGLEGASMVVTTVGMEKRESCDIYRPWENIAMKGDIVCIVIRLTLFYQCILKLVLIVKRLESQII
jgi:hypothetical protein